MDPFDGEEYLETRVRRRNWSMRRLYNKELHDFKFYPQRPTGSGYGGALSKVR
jgi:hypothetical protein